MNLFELSKKSFFVLLLSLMALVMLPACSSTEETPTTETGTEPPPETGSGGTYDECIAACGDGDSQCKEACVQDLPI